MMQSVSGALKINHYPDYIENVNEQQVIQSKLYVKGSGAGLANMDSWWAGQSDPYMELTATDESGVTEKKKTNIVGGNRCQPGIITWNFQTANGRRSLLLSGIMMVLVESLTDCVVQVI